MPFELDSLGKTEARSNVQVWLEVFGVYAVCIGFGFWVNPIDPFFLGTDTFSWLCIAPILVGARYGFTEAFVCALAVIGTSYATANITQQADWQINITQALGIMIVGMLVGEFRDIWERRLRKLERSNEYRQARLEEFTRAHHILKISHDRLEHASAGKANSLRSALLDLQQQCAERGPVVENVAEHGELIVSILKNYGTLQVASLHQARNGVVEDDPVATVGKPQQLQADDSLYRQALGSKKLVSVRADVVQSGGGDKSCYLACLPLVDTFGNLHAMLTIESMPFFALNESNLKLLAILAGRIADMFASFAEFPALTDESQHIFFREMRRCARDVQEFQIPASVLAIRSQNNATAPAYFETVLKNMRGLDLGYVVFDELQQNHVLLVLMPLTDANGVESYLIRFEEFMRTQHQTRIEDAQFIIHQHSIPDAESEKQLAQFLLSTVELEANELAVLQSENLAA